MASGVFTNTATKNGGTWTIRAYYSYTNQSSVTVTLTVAGYSGAHSWTDVEDAYWEINGSRTWTTFDFSGTTEYTIGLDISLSKRSKRPILCSIALASHGKSM